MHAFATGLQMIQEHHAANVPQQGTMSIGQMCPTGVIGGLALRGHTEEVIPNQIAFYRKRADLTQDELAERIGTTRNMLIKLEKGSRDLTSSWLEKLGQALKIEPFQLIAPAGLSDMSLSTVEAEPLRVDPETIAPILGALLPAVDPDQMTDQVLRALSGAFAYGLELLGDQRANRASPDAVAVAARGAIARFRELGSA